ncbi:MAG: flagellar hook-basal body protein [Lawsonibacter sp.]|nr:flagellar hook-basal body protein [Lawsonibacter sp.]
MVKGFYNLTSGMLTQGKKLDVISNNMTNAGTTGFKEDAFSSSTFDAVLWQRVSNSQSMDLGTQSYITAPIQISTDFTQGSLEETGLPLDFALEGDGFFAIQTDGGRFYTRTGSFSIDEEGYLALPGQGRVLDSAGNPIRLVTDKIQADDSGNLFTDDGGFLGQIGVYAFDDTATLEKNAQGLFQSQVQPQAAVVAVHHGMIEHSNVDLIQQMAAMITTQRAYQSAAQMTKMYDQVLSKVTTEVGRL